MELSTFYSGIEKHNAKIKETIKSAGIYVMHEHSYSYTVGLNQLDAPELIMFDQEKEIADEIFNLVFQGVKRGMLNPIDLEGLRAMINPPPTIMACSEHEKRSYFFAGRTFYGNWGFKCLKLVPGT